MSRTDKDAPYWVRADLTRFTPKHEYGCPFYFPRFTRRDPPNRECNLPERPVRQHRAHVSMKRLIIATFPWQCYWAAPYDRTWWYERPPSKKDRHFDWFGPDRAQARDECRAAMRDYNANGDTELDVVTDSPRHAGKQGYWW